jgi:phosphoribosyl-ATP pyrophosphohydrolase
MTDSVERLYEAVIAAKQGDPARSRTARLLRSGRPRWQEARREAVEVVIDAMNGNREAVRSGERRSHLQSVVLWVSSGVQPRMSGRKWSGASACSASPKKLLKEAADADPRRKVVTLEAAASARAASLEHNAALAHGTFRMRG